MSPLNKATSPADYSVHLFPKKASKDALENSFSENVE